MVLMTMASIPNAWLSLAAATFLVLGTAAGTDAAAQAGFSNSSATLSQAVGSAVAGALVPAKLDHSGWLWNPSLSSTSKRASTQSAEDWAKTNLNLYNNRFAANPGNLVLTADPVSGSGSGSDSGNQVLSVTYAANSYGLHTTPPGGTSFYPQPFLSTSGGASSTETPYVVTSHTAGQTNASSSSRPQLLLAYSVYFPENFDFVQGGKLPGLYSSVGSLPTSNGTIDASTGGCEGGSLGGTGTSCWSARIMWRTGGQGEVYMYIPQKLGGGYKLCPSKKASAKGADIICNSDFGLSIGRGSFTFRKGSWTDLALYIQVNEPNVTNGNLQLFVNGASSPTIKLDGIVFRSATQKPVSGSNNVAKHLSLSHRDIWDSNGETWVDKVMFTSFFGGSSAAWATPSATQTYFKNVSLFAGQSFSSEKGKSFTLNSAPRLSGSNSALGAAFALVVLMGTLL